jgi:hypothetical protein
MTSSNFLSSGQKICRIKRTLLSDGMNLVMKVRKSLLKTLLSIRKSIRWSSLAISTETVNDALARTLLNIMMSASITICTQTILPVLDFTLFKL